MFSKGSYEYMRRDIYLYIYICISKPEIIIIFIIIVYSINDIVHCLIVPRK